MVAATDLSIAGHDVEIFELRPYVGGTYPFRKMTIGNHTEMGLRVFFFFGGYYNLFGIMKRTGSFEKNFRTKEHEHTFGNEGGPTGFSRLQIPQWSSRVRRFLFCSGTDQSIKC